MPRLKYYNTITNEWEGVSTKGDPGKDGSSLLLDATLTKSNYAADAKAVGDAIRNISDNTSSSANTDEIYILAENETLDNVPDSAILVVDIGGELIDTPEGGGNSVLYTEQELTEEQRSQARKNIGLEDLLVKTTEVITDINLNDGVYEIGRFSVAGEEYDNEGNYAFRNVNYLPVEGGRTIVVYFEAAEWNGNRINWGVELVQYDSARAVIGNAKHYIENYRNNSKSSFTLDANAAFIRIHYNRNGEMVFEDMTAPKIAIYYIEDAVQEFVEYGADAETILMVRRDRVQGLVALAGKKIVYDGDSICAGSAANAGGGYARIIADLTGGEYVNHAVGGGRLCSGVADRHCVADNLPNLPTDGDIYCFQGGINDYWGNAVLGTYTPGDYTGAVDATTVCGALETIFRYALTNFPGKRVCFVITHKVQNTAYQKNGAGNTFKDYRDAMAGICQKYSIPFYDAFSESGLNGWNDAQNNQYLTGNTDGTPDGCHPNEDGYRRFYVDHLIDLFETGRSSSSGATSASGGSVDLTGYAKEQWVQQNYQPKGNYLTEVPEGYAKTADIPTKPGDIGAQPAGNYLTEVPSGYATEEFVKNKIAEAEMGDKEVDLSGYAQKSELPTKISQLENDSGYLTEHQDISGKLDASELPTAINTALAQAKASGEFDGADGQPGKDGKDGSPGKDGSDGVSATHSWNGTVLTVTSASGTSSADLKGDKGDKGDTGATGQRGTGLLAVTTAPSSYTTAVGGITPKYRMSLSTIKTQAGVTEVLLGDSVRYSYYHYPIAYLDASYAYFTTRVSIRGATGADGKDYSFDPTVYRLPILHLTGDTTGMTKETEVTLSYECNDKDGTAKTGSCTMKWQGSSSLAWDKKNYTIKFDNAFEVVNGWGSQKKYCLKANWIDHSHSRNVVSAKLWGLVRKNRSNLNSKLKTLPNAGAIDGFPVIIMLNGEFHGLYSWNIPKDAWMFGMGSGTKEAIVGADNQADDTAFKAETLLDADGWELEYNSSSFTADAVKTSLNNLIKACINSFGGDLDTEVAKYLDWESAIDYYIFAVILQGGDMITKNTILATFDGVKWYFSAYDMDTTYGLEFDGSKLNRAVTTSHTSFETIAETHRVFELIKRFKTNELKARYNALRADVLSESRICNYFENYAWDISSPILVEEVKKWPSVRGSAVNGIDQICRWVRQRLEVTDKWINALPAQETPVEPDEPVEIVNQVPISTDTDGAIYNGTGYKDNTRLSSSGGVSSSAQTGSVVTGFIPFKDGDVIRIKGATWTFRSGEHHYLNFYNSNKALIEARSAEAQASNPTGMSVTYDSTTGVTTIDVAEDTAFGSAVANAAYFRINAYGKGADLIITVNQEIT